MATPGDDRDPKRGPEKPEDTKKRPGWNRNVPKPKNIPSAASTPTSTQTGATLPRPPALARESVGLTRSKSSQGLRAPGQRHTPSLARPALPPSFLHPQPRLSFQSTQGPSSALSLGPSSSLGQGTPSPVQDPSSFMQDIQHHGATPSDITTETPIQQGRSRDPGFRSGEEPPPAGQGSPQGQFTSSAGGLLQSTVGELRHFASSIAARGGNMDQPILQQAQQLQTNTTALHKECQGVIAERGRLERNLEDVKRTREEDGEMRATIQTLEAKLETAEKKAEDAEQNADTLAEELAEIKQKYQTAKTNLNELQGSYEMLGMQAEAAEAQIQTIQKRLTDANKRVADVNADADERLADADRRFAERLAAANKRIVDTETQARQTQDAYDMVSARRTAAEAERIQLLEENTGYTDSIDKISQQIQTAIGVRDMLRNEQAKLTQELTTAKADIVRRGEELAAARGKIDRLKQDAEAAQAETRSRDQEATTVEENLNQKLSAAQSEINALKQEAARLTAVANATEAAANLQQTEINRLNEAVATAQAHLDRRSQEEVVLENNRLKQELANTKAELADTKAALTGFTDQGRRRALAPSLPRYRSNVLPLPRSPARLPRVILARFLRPLVRSRSHYRAALLRP